MRLLWASPRALTVREVILLFDAPQPAYTTVATALSRLHKKGAVLREGAASDGYRFAAAHTEADHTGAQMLQALKDTGDRKAALLNFAGNLDADDKALLREAFGD